MPINLKDIPSGALVAQAYIPASASGDSSIVHPVFYAPVAAKILAAYWIPITTHSGTATNYRTLTLQDRGTAGTGSRTLGTAVALSATSVSCTALDATALVATTDAETVAAGAMVALSNAKTSSGVATPAGLCVVVWWPTSETIT